MDSTTPSASSSSHASPERVPLRVMGLSINKIQGTAYALILAEQNGPLRVPVVIGASEAQAIASAIEGMKPLRPFPHDLFTAMGHAFGIRPVEVLIYKFQDGVFYSEITFTDSERTVSFDARTSDAIAIAMRFSTPIFATREVMDLAGFAIEEMNVGAPSAVADSTELPAPSSAPSAASAPDELPGEPRLENYAIPELERTLERLIADEKYEEAARVSEILRRKRES